MTENEGEMQKPHIWQNLAKRVPYGGIYTEKVGNGAF
jgi:hypothetical protein